MALNRSARLAGLWALVPVVLMVAVLLGPQSLGFQEAREPLPWQTPWFWQLRLPRVCLAALAGATLAASGSALQALLGNPLADPWSTGATGGATLLGTWTLVLAGEAWIPMGAMLGALVALLVTTAVGRSNRQALLLSGLGVNALAASALNIVRLGLWPEDAQRLDGWLVGAIPSSGWPQLTALAAGLGIWGLGLWRLTPMLNLLATGDLATKLQGHSPQKLRQGIYGALGLAIGAVAAFTGMLGFVGLWIPHTARRLVGADLTWALPASAALGAMVVVLSDLLGRLAYVWCASEVPAGALLGLWGGPALLVHLMRQSKQRLR